MHPSLPCPAADHADDALREHLRARLAAFEVQAVPLPPGSRRAAVALVVVDEAEGGALDGLPAFAAGQPSRRGALLLTRRAATLARHAGQWALPGGRLDAGETPEAAALRELAEETGLVLPPSALLGRLDDFATRSGFVITPVVAWAGTVQGFAPDPAEVESVHRIPLAEFLRADAPWLDAHEIGAGAAPVLRMPVGTSWIAAPTAALLYQFREVALLGRATRVAHFEQPRFAWT